MKHFLSFLKKYRGIINVNSFLWLIVDLFNYSFIWLSRFEYTSYHWWIHRCNHQYHLYIPFLLGQYWHLFEGLHFLCMLCINNHLVPHQGPMYLRLMCYSSWWELNWICMEFYSLYRIILQFLHFRWSDQGLCRIYNKECEWWPIRHWRHILFGIEFKEKIHIVLY